MTDQVCPSCGKTALSVATRCPRCGAAFDTQSYRWAEPPRRRRMPPGLVIVSLLVAGVIGNALWEARKAPLTRVPLSEAGMPAPAATKEPEPVKPVTAAAPKPASTPVVVHPPPAPAVLPSVSGSERRYASTWMNLRAGRSNRARVVRILKPGEAVLVDSLDQGWYRVLSVDRAEGYVDRRLLSATPPPTRIR